MQTGTSTIDYGPKNPHDVGAILRDLMQRTTLEIHKRRTGFVGQHKPHPDKLDDRVTDADFASQAIFVKKLTESFPDYGIVAEEKGFMRPCTLQGRKLFFTVDPLDGTKAFERKQSHGFGPMLSLSTDEEVVAAFVGEAMTRELYYYRPESSKVHRLNLIDYQHELLSIDAKRPLSDQHVLLRDNPLDLPVGYAQVAQSAKHHGLFKNIEIAGGGIGSGMARLWKGEVGGYIVKAGMYQPWDLLPIWGISDKLGFVWMAFNGSPKSWEVKDKLKPSMEPVEFDTPNIIIHQSRVDEFINDANDIIRLRILGVC